MRKGKNCNSCRHDLGGGRENCRINQEYECILCGRFELWEGKSVGVDAFAPSEDEDAGEDDGFLPKRRKDQIPFMVFLCISCMLLGAIIYKYALIIF